MAKGIRCGLKYHYYLLSETISLVNFETLVKACQLANEDFNTLILFDEPIGFHIVRATHDMQALWHKLDCLEKAGFEPNRVTEKDGDHLLHILLLCQIEYKDPQFLEKLFTLFPGLQVNIQNKVGLTPLHLAALTRQESFGVTLIKKMEEANSAQLDLKDGQGRTPLMLASTLGCEQLVKALLSRGANAQEKDRRGHTASRYTSASKDLVFELLKSVGLEPERSLHTSYSYIQSGKGLLHIVGISHNGETTPLVLSRKGIHWEALQSILLKNQAVHDPKLQGINRRLPPSISPAKIKGLGPHLKDLLEAKDDKTIYDQIASSRITVQTILQNHLAHKVPQSPPTPQNPSRPTSLPSPVSHHNNPKNTALAYKSFEMLVSALYHETSLDKEILHIKHALQRRNYDLAFLATCRLKNITDKSVSHQRSFIKALLVLDADPYGEDNQGQDALMCAIKAKNKNLVCFLIERSLKPSQAHVDTAQSIGDTHLSTFLGNLIPPACLVQ